MRIRYPEIHIYEECNCSHANKELALKQMRIDWLELQLKWERERAAERNSLRSQKQLKKKKKKRK